MATLNGIFGISNLGFSLVVDSTGGLSTGGLSTGGLSTGGLLTAWFINRWFKWLKFYYF